MARKSNTKSGFMAGMYLLETLTAGMYNDPLAIYREYIQNAADSIDIALNKNRRNSKRIHINLDPVEKSITIYDKGIGISTDLSEKILNSVGISSKINSKLRGFRGIGRLGGLAFCDFATFRTKAKGENVESIQEWDCIKLRNGMSGSRNKPYSLRQLFNKATKIYQKNNKIESGSYFEVKLFGIQSFRNHIMDIRKVHDYLSSTAPVPFNPGELSFASEINDYLSSHLKNFSHYDIILNGEPIFKPYRDLVKLTSRGHDVLLGFEPFEIKIGEGTVGYGWLGKRKDLLGAITRGDLSSGIRVRDGNIQIGDSHLLDGCFRESRFNSYMIGEIHVDCAELIPNSRRDDFIDNETKGLFYDAVEREIGLRISKGIRLNSRLKSKKEWPTQKDSAPINPSAANDNNIDKQSHQETQLRDVFKILPNQCKECNVIKELIYKNKHNI
jgi:molecular chaperone HtpG